MRILVVEDELALSEALEEILKKNKYSVDLAHDGRSGLNYALSGIHDLIILDIMLPRMDGLEVLRKIRQGKVATPVILLTARGEVSDRVTGLDAGADDYLPKPFATEELLARVRAASRRRADVVPEDALKYADIELNPNTLMLSCGTKEVKLILKEKELLELLIARREMATPKDLILEKLWGYDSEAVDNHAEVYVSFLRKKLTFLGSRARITTTRGVGYQLENHR